MNNILLCLGYDGSKFHGYQRQKRDRSVQGDLEDALRTVLGQGTPPQTHSAGRTDVGVHAERQYTNFKVAQTRVPPEKLSLALNAALPKDVRVFWSREVAQDFHARYCAIARCYYYQFFSGRIVAPSYRNCAVGVSEAIDWGGVQTDLNELLGTHDFSAFSTQNEQVSHSVRTLLRAEVKAHGDFMRIYITANGFLWKMVRTIVGTVLERAACRERGLKVDRSMKDILEGRDRSCAGTTAPPLGLFLYDVQYKEEYGITGRKITG